MDTQSKSSELQSIDFGMSEGGISNIPKGKMRLSDLSQRNTNNSFKKINFGLIIKNFAKFLKFLSTRGGKIKASIYKTIFIGRGVYFKYVANLAVAFVFLISVYMFFGYDPKGREFVSKYSSVKGYSDSQVTALASQTDFTKNQYKIVQYTVVSGDTLSGIASKFSKEDAVISVDSIVWANNLKSSDVILKPGMTLTIPPVSGVIHVIKKGDTLNSLAKKYKLIDDKTPVDLVNGVYQNIIETNNLEIKTILTDKGESQKIELPPIGSKLILPGGIVIADVPVVIPQKPIQQSPGLPQVKAPNGGFIWPIYGGEGVVSQGYHAGHKAIDIAKGWPKVGPYVVAMADGTVTQISWQSGGGGNMIFVTFDNGFDAAYAHLSVYDSAIYDAYAKGQRPRVTQGQVLGRAGQTGRAFGTHLHLELNYRGQRLKPCDYLDKC